jgi:hypothetical protein
MTVIGTGDLLKSNGEEIVRFAGKHGARECTYLRLAIRR